MEKFKIRDLIELLILPIATAGVYILWDLNQNVNKLNFQVGVIIAEKSIDREDIKDLKVRVRDLEMKK